MALRITFICVCWLGISWAQQVNTPDGPIQGTTDTTAVTGRTYYAYFNIRYGKEPTGTRRFLPAEPIDPWTTLYNATADSTIMCYQLFSSGDPNQQEDCLFLNVFTPQRPGSGGKLPVMVWIHGGGFIGGSRHGYGPKYFLEEDVLLVTINYRVGVFGFLSSGDSVIPGNAGLHDQILALQWIKKNIESFGGDPNKVTIFGQSAGGSSTGYLVLSPAAKGLFVGAILQSGSALIPFGYQRYHVDLAFRTGAAIDPSLGTNRDSKKLLEVLQNADAKTVNDASTTAADWYAAQPDSATTSQPNQGYFFTPVYEAPNDNAVLTERQYEAVKNGHVNNVPIMIGMVSEEGLFELDDYLPYLLSGYDKNLSTIVPGNMHVSDVPIKFVIGLAIKQEYSPDRSFSDNYAAAINFFTEQSFAKPQVKHAELQSQYTDVYFYYFDYKGKMGWGGKEYPGTNNITHSEELGYLFMGLPPVWYPESDQITQKRMVTLWTNFAKYQNPTPKPDAVLQNVIWPKVQPNNFRYLHITENLIATTGKPRSERLAFWDKLYDTFGVPPYDTY